MLDKVEIENALQNLDDQYDVLLSTLDELGQQVDAMQQEYGKGKSETAKAREEVVTVEA